MKISYNWLKEFIPGIPEPNALSNILTSVGLEVENVEEFEEIKGSLAGLLVGEVLQISNHPDADKLKITEVDTGGGNIFRIVCGAANVAARQKVIVAPAGSTIYPLNEKPVTIKKARIRGVESNGMICAEDEIGIGNDHSGIIVLPDNIATGSPAAAYFKLQSDWIFEIGLTPNRIDAMSHIGVAKDVCAYLSHALKERIEIISPFKTDFKADSNNLPVGVTIENKVACERYSGVTIANIEIKPSPKWMQFKLKSIGLRPVNNIVDITNYILHETGQPLHAFDLQAISGHKVAVKNLPESTLFITLDEKERKLHAEDLMICNGSDEPMCFGGVFGGLYSGVKNSTTHIFLESAWFRPSVIRRTSLRHNLRTDAATRFEKGVDISQAVQVLERAATLIKELAGGEIASAVIDVYPAPKKPAMVKLPDQYLTKMSGKSYPREEVKSILKTLGFQIEKEDPDALMVAVPFSKPDITMPADILEEIMRIDGFDNVEIPTSISITPALETNGSNASYKESIANYLTGSGFSEIFTNSITNSKYYDQTNLVNSVKILNSLSADLDIMRPSLIETGLESISYNLNRKNNDLLFFEFGNTYAVTEGNYNETEHLCLHISGNKSSQGWKAKPVKADFYFLKGICQNIFNIFGLIDVEFNISKSNYFEYQLTAFINKIRIVEFGVLKNTVLQKFGIKQPVLFADMLWKDMLEASKASIVYEDIPRFPFVQRDLSIVVNTHTAYSQIEGLIQGLGIKRLKKVKLFDVFESEKLGPDKKAFAISLTFVDAEKTLTDNETDSWVNRIIASLENNLGAAIRK